MEIREKVVSVLRDASFRSYVRFKQQRRSVALAAFEGADEATLREVRHHIRSVRYAEVCPAFFRRSEDLFAAELLVSVPSREKDLINYIRFIRGASVTMLAFIGVPTKDMPLIRIDQIDFAHRTLIAGGKSYSFSVMTGAILQDFVSVPAAFNPGGAAWLHTKQRCSTYLFSIIKDEPIGVNDMRTAVVDMRAVTSEGNFYTDAYLAALNGDLVRARARIDQGQSREEAFEEVLKHSVEPRGLEAFSETYDAFLRLCP